MKIINIGVLAHVDAGKTTLTESLLYNSGAITELGSVDKGTTRTDNTLLERQRGITIQTGITSFQWENTKVNIIDTPGHMDFLAEVYRSLSVLDGAILLISAKDGVQAQTRILFHALRKMGIPTIFFINKIDQNGIDLSTVYQDIKEKLSAEIVIKQKVELYPNMCVTNFTESEQWDTVIEGNDDLLEKYMSGKSLEALELEQEESIRFQNCSLFPLYHGSAKSNIGIDNLIEVITNKFYSSTHRGPSELCGNVFKIEYTKKRQRLAYIRLYSGVLHLRDSVRVSEKEKIKVTEMYTSINGELCKIDRAYSGEIVILQNEFLKLNSVLGDTKLLPQRKKIENPHPLLQTTVEPSKPEQREMLLDALLEISDSDPLLRYYVDSTTHEIILSFLGKVQMEVISALLQEKYHVEIELKEPTVIYMERPLKNAEYTIHIEVPPNPFWASIGLSVSPLPLGSGMQYESSVSLGYLNQSLQNAVMEGIRYGCEQGLYGWNVTDCKICFKYGLYYSPVSTPNTTNFDSNRTVFNLLNNPDGILEYKIFVPTIESQPTDDGRLLIDLSSKLKKGKFKYSFALIKQYSIYRSYLFLDEIEGDFIDFVLEKSKNKDNFISLVNIINQQLGLNYDAYNYNRVALVIKIYDEHYYDFHLNISSPMAATTSKLTLIEEKYIDAWLELSTTEKIQELVLIKKESFL